VRFVRPKDTTAVEILAEALVRDEPTYRPTGGSLTAEIPTGSS
jgi:hypothetical protein